MARKCFMCGREVTAGILCEKCDKPRRKGSSEPVPAAETDHPEPSESAPSTRDAAPVTRDAVPAAEPGRAAASEPPRAAASEQGAPARSGSSVAALLDHDPFPKAPVLPFPVESASPAITSVVHLLVASGVASVLVGPDRSIKFVSDSARKLFDAVQSDLNTLSAIEAHAGIRVGELSLPATAGIHIANRNFIYTLVPISGGASGAVLVFRPADALNQAHASFDTYVRETVLGPLRSLRDSLAAAARTRDDHFLADTAASIEQVLSSLELAPEVEEGTPGVRPVPRVTEVVHRVADRFRAFADLKGITFDVDVQDLDERIADHEQLAESLAILMENALHYVPAGGQVVIGVRWMEHKGKPLLLFFVMDNGPLVPEELRQAIFEPSFAWQPGATERTGRGLFRCREFAVAHAGSVWVESKTGKACTFFLRIRPDGVR